MVDAWERSRKRSSGKRAKRRNASTLYLDANFDCREVKDRLSTAKVKFEAHSDHLAANASDEEVLSLVGRRDWILITADRRQKYRDAERKTILQHNVRQFVLPGSLGAAKMADVLATNINRIKKFCEENKPPFSAHLNASGKITPRNL